MDLKDKRFLVVDDHSLMRRMVGQDLYQKGVDVVDEASDGDAALRKIQAALSEGRPYDVVFLDWTMPTVSGFDVLTSCRADRALDDLAIVMLSSESEEPNIVKAMEAGATAYITKPFKQGDVARKAVDVLAWREKNKSGS